MKDIEKLDNPVWYSLSETHSDFAILYPSISFYKPEYCLFGAFLNIQNYTSDIEEYSKLNPDFFILGEKPELQESIIIKKELVCLQMILFEKNAHEITEEIIPLGPEHYKELFELVLLVQPGYFRQKTAVLGTYFGIFKDNKLIAAAGERLQMNSFTEISAVVTHPDYTRKGFAKQLTTHTANAIFDKGKIPYLHVSELNSIAIGVYQSLGFKTRRKISFWNLIRK